MSQFKYTSWGRTRRPKSVHGASGTEEAATSTDAPSNASADNSNQGYSTENQRICHIMTSGSASVTNMYMYNFSAGFWSELLTGSLGGAVVVGCTSTPQYRVV